MVCLTYSILFYLVLCCFHILVTGTVSVFKIVITHSVSAYGDTHTFFRLCEKKYVLTPTSSTLCLPNQMLDWEFF